MSWTEVAAVITGFVCVALTVRESVASWPVGIVSCALYIVVFLDAKLYADMALQGVYVVLSLYGWYRWARPSAASLAAEKLPVTQAEALELATLALFATATTTVWGFYLRHHTDASLPYVDAGLTSASLAAQWLLTRKKVENWAVWIVADIVYVGLFATKALWLTAGLYAAFTCLAVWGLVRWRRQLRGASA